MSDAKKETVQVSYSGDCREFKVLYEHKTYAIPSTKWEKEVKPTKVPKGLYDEWKAYLKEEK